jgi:pSer/pThr/pTyr-binding forkhead associated (FHA) protein
MARGAKQERERAAGGTPPAGAFVCVESGFYAGLEWPLDRACTVIGRGRNADLALSEATISRSHAVLGFEDGHLYVEDLGSTNGTLVNGVRERRARLGDGDELAMGKLQLRIRLAPGARRAAVA